MDIGNKKEDDKVKKEKTDENTYLTNAPKIGQKGPSKLRQKFNRGMTFFLVVFVCILIYFAMLRIEDISRGISMVLGVLKPVVYGCVIAYLLNPIVKTVDKYLLPVLQKNMKNQERAKALSRGAGIFLALVLMIMLVVALCNLLLPELYSSIRNLIFTLPGQLNDLVDRFSEVKLGDSAMTALLKDAFKEGSATFQNWLRTDFMDMINEVMSQLTVGLINLVGELVNALIGIIISIYILFGKEKFACQGKKAIYAMLSPEHSNIVLHLAIKTSEIFGDFIIGKMLDSAIIGVLCFFALSIMNMPYTLLVSVIVGVTNVIPFFGPYIGAIPSAILIILSDPIKGIYFIIFILILQQFDGNILGPKILGNSTGLSAFWVIVAILLGGGLFGFIGMLLGVPTFAVIYYIVELLLNNWLERKKLPTDSKYYDTMSYVDNNGKYVHSKSQVRCDDYAHPKTAVEEQKENNEKGE